MSFHAPNISKSLLEAVAAVMAEGAAGRMLANNPKAKKDMEAAGDSTMTYRGKDEKGTYTVKKHRATGTSEYKEVGQRVYEDEQIDEAAGRMLAKSPTAKKDMEGAGDSTMTYRGKDEKGTYTVKKHRATGTSEYKEVGQRVYEDEQIDEAAGRMLAKSPTAKKDMEGAGDSTMTYRGKDEKGTYTVKKHRAKGASEYKEVGQRVYEDEQIDEAAKSADVEYAAKKKEVIALAKKLIAKYENHGKGEKIHWGHVGDLGHWIKKLKELSEGEQLDELSDKLLHNYSRKADRASANWSHNERQAAAGDKDAAERAAKDQKRHAGIDLAKKKLAAKPNTPVKEDVEQLDQLNEGPDTKVDGLDGLIKQSIEQFKKHYGKEWSKVMHASVDRLAEGAFSDMDIDRQETKADPKRKEQYTKDFNELLAKHKGAGLNPSERKRLTRLSIILGKKLPGA